jgi:hypothetical protein
MNKNEREEKLISKFFEVMENFYDEDSDTIDSLSIMSIAMSKLAGGHANVLREFGSDSIVTHFKNMTVNQIEAV